MKLLVDKKQRYAKMRAHSATHLLHYGLEKMLGTTKQAWSLVDQDYVRFDFACKKPLWFEDLQLLESTINTWISEYIDVVTDEMSLEEANKSWAKAFFEDKYGDTVRVVRMKWSVQNDLDLESSELCGGTHVTNTSEIWAFKIINHTAVASWIKRIEAVTGIKVAEYAQEHQQRIINISNQLDCQPSQLENKIDKILKDYNHILSDHEALEGKIICTHLEEMNNECELPSAWSKRWKWCLINVTDTDLWHHTFKEVVNVAKSKWHDRNRIIYNNEWNFAIYIGNGEMSAKEFASSVKLKWWGSDQFVQWKDSQILNVI